MTLDLSAALHSDSHQVFGAHLCRFVLQCSSQYFKHQCLCQALLGLVQLPLDSIHTHSFPLIHW
jgi:hypothetical protein